jgi:hypothetical protein
VPREYGRIESTSILLFLTGVFAISGIWIFHLERGQQYIYLAALLVLAIFPPFASRPAARRIFSALSVFFRFSLAPVAFLSFREKRPFRDLFLAGLVGVVLLVPVLAKYPIEWWADYFASTRDWYFHRFGLHERVPTLPIRLPLAPEGDPSLRSYLNFAVPGNILHHYAMKLVGYVIPYGVGLIAFICGTAALGWSLYRARAESIQRFALRFFAGIYVLDHVLPAPRSGYNAVLFFPGIALGILLWLSTRTKTKSERDWDWSVATPFAVAILYSLGSIWSPVSSPYGVETFYLFGAFLAVAQPVRSESPNA